MVSEWITSLAASGASALVGAVATDTWQTTRNGIVRLFGRGGPRRQELASEWLDADARALEEADSIDHDQVRCQLLPAWQTRLADLLEEFSDDAGPQSEVATELAQFVETIQNQLPTVQQTWVQNLSNSGVVALGGNVRLRGRYVAGRDLRMHSDQDKRDDR